MSTIFWIILCVGSASGVTMEPAKSEWVKISCDFHPDYLRNLSCELKPVKRFLKLLKIHLTVYRPLETLNIRIRNLKKTSANRYMPGVIDITKDLCQMMTGPGMVFLVNTLKFVYEEGLKQFQTYFRECPYSGTFHYEEMIDEKNSSSVNYLDPGEYQTEVTFFSNNDLVYFRLKTFFKLKYRK